jgi:tRNA threonylcarbamoyl adenosine modification protein YjeE
MTRMLGFIIGKLAPPGAILALGGELGAGKTTLVQGVARGVGVPDEYYITSPTFTLINEYPGRRVLYHVDLYRIGDPDEAMEIGLEEILEGDGLVAIEWLSGWRFCCLTDILASTSKPGKPVSGLSGSRPTERQWKNSFNPFGMSGGELVKWH